MPPRRHVEVVVDRLPQCDICGAQARFDAKTIHGGWANLCRPCFSDLGLGLGLGLGQRLIEKGKPEEV